MLLGAQLSAYILEATAFLRYHFVHRSNLQGTFSPWCLNVLQLWGCAYSYESSSTCTTGQAAPSQDHSILCKIFLMFYQSLMFLNHKLSFIQDYSFQNLHCGQKFTFRAFLSFSHSQILEITSQDRALSLLTWITLKLRWSTCVKVDSWEEIKLEQFWESYWFLHLQICGMLRRAEIYICSSFQNYFCTISL